MSEEWEEDSDRVFKALKNMGSYKECEQAVTLLYIPDMSFSRAGLCHALNRLEKHFGTTEKPIPPSGRILKEGEQPSASDYPPPPPKRIIREGCSVAMPEATKDVILGLRSYKPRVTQRVFMLIICAILLSVCAVGGL